MIQAIQAQARQRPGRLIRGGERNAAPVTSEPPRFVPRPLSEHEARVTPAPSQPARHTSERPIMDEGRVHAPSAETPAISLTTQTITTPESPSEMITQQNVHVEMRTEGHTDIINLETAGDEIAPPSYIKPLSQRLTSLGESSSNTEDIAPVAIPGSLEQPDHELITEEDSSSPQRLTLESLTELLERISLTPWRINTYEGGQGQILWLQNGSHLDYNPAGELILGGENQDETRIRLSHVGIEV